MTLEATSSAGAVATFTASAFDIVDGAITPTCTPASGSTFPLGTTSVTCNATDAAGNTGTASFNVTVQDTTKPVVTVPADMTLEATGPAGAVATFTASAFDIVDGSITPTCTPASGSTFPLGTTTVTCDATDAASNTGTASFNVTVQDTTKPVVTVPADMTLEATSSAGAVATFIASASDIVDGSLVPTCTPASGSTFPLGTTTVTCDATDAAGNTGSASFNVTVQDTTKPVVTVPADMTLEATSSAGAVATFTASASDIVDGALTPTCTPVSGSTFPLGTTSVTCNATDAAGNTGTASFNVTVQDTTKPVVTVPADMTLEATSSAGAVATFTASASDIVDGPLTPTCTPVSGSTFPLGTTTVTCDATDAAGNTGTASFKITVQDTTKPVVTVPADITKEATGPTGAVATFTASASDIVDGSITPTCTPASGSTFPLGTTSVTCNATDAAGNTGTASFNVTVQDTTKPVVTVPADMTLEATSSAGAVATFTASASDIVDGSITPTCTPVSGSTFPLGTTSVTCNATDSAGNAGTASFNITVQDTTKPVVTVPANMTLEATSSAGAVATFTASANDIVDGALTPTCTPASGSTFPLGTTTVTCDATDAAGNTGTASFNVTVQDTTKPVVTVPADITKEATGPSGATATFTASALDIVDGSITPTCTPVSGSTFPLGTTSVTCNATDAAGNTGTASFNVTVQDTTKPVVTVPADMTIEATGPTGAAATFTASASDIVDGSIAPTCTPASGSTFPLGTTSVTCNATDAAGNTGTVSFNVTVQDTTKPVVTVPADKTVEATGSAGAVVNFTASALDIVDGSIAPTCTPASGSTFPIGTTSVTCNATDAAGNTGTASFNITVQDTTPPTVTVPSNMVLQATGPAGAVATFVSSASDIVDGALTPVCTPDSGSTFPIGITAVTCSVTDAHGNLGTATFNVTIQDTIPPALTLPADMTLEATGPSGAAATFSATAVDIVDGSVPVTCTPASGSTFAIGSTTVNCSATDSGANTSSGTFTVTVKDTTSPIIAPHANIVFISSDMGDTFKVVFDYPATSDIVDGNGVASCSAVSGQSFPVGLTTVTCTAVDAHGNKAAPITFTVQVIPGDPRGFIPTAPVTLIPVTGGNMLTIKCANPAAFTVNLEDVKVVFTNLCEYQAMLLGQLENELPGTLDAGQSFVNAIDLELIKSGKIVDLLPSDANITVEFNLSKDKQKAEFTLMFWNETELKWVEVKGEKTEDGKFTASVGESGIYVLVEKK
jgi:hypothetical protein